MAIMSGGLPSLVMVIGSGAPRADVMTIAQAARDAIIQPAGLQFAPALRTRRAKRKETPSTAYGRLWMKH